MKNEKGYTLIELIVTFVLIGILMSSASVVLTAFMRMFLRVDATVKTQTVSDMLMETLASDIESAADIAFDEENNKDVCLEIADGGKEIHYVDKNNFRVIVKEKDGYLLFDYQGVGGQPGEAAALDTQWYYGRSNYMGAKITELLFEKKEDNLIQITMTLYHDKSDFTLTSKKIFPCFNLKTADISAE